MKRIVFLFVVLLSVVGATLSTVYPARMQAPATNTPRPASPTQPITNTPRVTVTRGRSATPTRTPTNTKTPTTTPTITPTTIGPYNYPDNVNPLTGLAYPNDDAKNR